MTQQIPHYAEFENNFAETALITLAKLSTPAPARHKPQAAPLRPAIVGPTNHAKERAGALRCDIILSH